MSAPSAVRSIYGLLHQACVHVCVRSGGGGGDSPRSLLFIMALEPRRRGPCWVKWYPNFSRVVFFSSMLAISISTLFPKGWLWGEREGRHERRDWGTEKNSRREEEAHAALNPTHLVVYLQLLQCGVVLQRFDQGQDSCPRDEVRLHVQALQSRVHFQHLSQSLKKHQTLTIAHDCNSHFWYLLPQWHRRVKNNSSKLMVYRYNKRIWRAWRTKQTCTRDSRMQQGRCSWFLRCWTSPPLCSLSEPRRTTSGSWWGCSECGKQNSNKTLQLSRTSFSVSHRSSPWQRAHLDIVEVDLHQVGVIPLQSQQGFFYIGGVGLFVGDWFILGALDDTCNTFPSQTFGRKERQT